MAEMQENSGNTFWAYLDVWERHVTYFEEPLIREVALGGPETCTRSQVVWQVKGLRIAQAPAGGNADAIAKVAKAIADLKAKLAQTTDPVEVKVLENEMNRLQARLKELQAGQPGADGQLNCADPLGDLLSISDASMAVRVDPGPVVDDPCILPPQSRFRGMENHFYRVEVHAPGTADVATFKWSRDNGSVLAAWLGTSGNDLTVSSGRGFTAGCWVELIDDTQELLGRPGTLVKVARVEGQTLSIDPASVETATALAWSTLLVHPKVRRWDQTENGDIVLSHGAVPLTESTSTTAAWLDLEDGLQIEFAPGGTYRTGDYWTIPARTATGTIEWPVTSTGDAAFLSPFGIEHHYAPLGFVSWTNKTPSLQGCNCTFQPQSDCAVAALALVPIESRRTPVAIRTRPRVAVAPPRERPATSAASATAAASVPVKKRAKRGKG
jgi:hypothetical protein